MPPEGVDLDEWVERFFALPTADPAEVAVLRALLRAGAVVEEWWGPVQHGVWCLRLRLGPLDWLSGCERGYRDRLAVRRTSGAAGSSRMLLEDLVSVVAADAAEPLPVDPASADLLVEWITRRPELLDRVASAFERCYRAHMDDARTRDECALARANVVEEMRAAYRVRDGRRWPVLRLP